jgi:hypothetical protein
VVRAEPVAGAGPSRHLFSTPAAAETISRISSAIRPGSSFIVKWPASGIVARSYDARALLIRKPGIVTFADMTQAIAPESQSRGTSDSWRSRDAR